MKCRFFRGPLPLFLTASSVMTVGIVMAAASKPLATALSMKLAMTVAGTASLATGLLAAGIVLAALGTLALVVGLMFCMRHLRNQHRYTDDSGPSMRHDSSDPGKQRRFRSTNSNY